MIQSLRTGSNFQAEGAVRTKAGKIQHMQETEKGPVWTELPLWGKSK